MVNSIILSIYDKDAPTRLITNVGSDAVDAFFFLTKTLELCGG